MMRHIRKLISKSGSLEKSTSGSSKHTQSAAEEKSQSSETVPAPREMLGYYIGPTLGQGHFARVKLGVDKETGEKVALKLIIKDAIGEDSSEFRTVKREVDALSAVQHENVLKLHKVDWEARFPKGNDKFENVAAIILELAEGGELFDFLLYSGAMNEVVARTYFQQLISGIEQCHAKGVVHRDLKLENVLLTKDYTLKIADFGLSELNVTNEKTKMTQWCGTKRYMAPELHENRSYTLKVDIFACAIILFILLGGYPPFVYATRDDELYHYIYEGDFKGFWRKHASFDKASFSSEVKDLLNGMFAYDKNERFGVKQIKEHPWFNGEVLTKEQLTEELSARKKQVDESRAAKKPKPGEKKTSKLSRLDTEVESAHRAFFKGATLGSDLDIVTGAAPELWDDEEYGAAIYTKFESKAKADTLLSSMRNLMQSMKYKYMLDEQEFEITSTLQDPDMINMGEIEQISVSIKVFQAADPSFRVVVVRRLEGDSFVFQRFFVEFIEAMGKLVA